MKKKLVMYRIEGEDAKQIFGSHPRAAAESSIVDPSKGLGVIISLLTDDIEETVKALRASKELYRDKKVNELLIYKENLTEAMNITTALFLELSVLKYLADLKDGEGQDAS